MTTSTTPPTATPPTTKPPQCPECKTALVLVDGELPEECAKCGFVLSGWEGFKRWMKAWLEENPIKPVEKEPIAQPKSKNPLANLTRKRTK